MSHLGFIFLQKINKGRYFMCMKNNQSINAYSSPCSTCYEYLFSCMPVVVNGYLFGECDLCYCEFCACYEECMNLERS